jgi:molybdate transport system regulatory protein
MQPRMKIWLESQEKLALSDYRLRLLRAIAETGSLASAAEQLGLSYRRAWGKVREIEQNLGYKLIESSAGGAGGGGSQLTPEGVALLDRYDRFAQESRAIVARLYDEIFSPETPTKPASVRSDRGGPR